MQITGTLQSVAPRQVPKKDGTGFWTFFDALIDGKKYQVQQDTYNQSVGLVGQVVLADTINEQRNGFDNWKATAIFPASSTAVNAANAAGVAVTNQAIQAVVNAQAAQAAGPIRSDADKNRDAMIVRQTAGKATAALLSGSGVGVDLFIDVAAKVAQWMETGVKPSEVAVVQALASELNAEFAPDDIPF